MRGVAGYGRYNDDPTHVGCPRARSDMTPCIARDGRTALADDGTCVACGGDPVQLLGELMTETGRTGALMVGKRGRRARTQAAADGLTRLVRDVTEELTR